MSSPSLGKEEAGATIQAGKVVGSSSVEKDLEALVDIKQEHRLPAKKANRILCCSSHRMKQSLSDHHLLGRPCSIQSGDRQCRRAMDKLERLQQGH